MEQAVPGRDSNSDRSWSSVARKVCLLGSMVYVAGLVVTGSTPGMLSVSAGVVALLGFIGLRLPAAEIAAEQMEARKRQQEAAILAASAAPERGPALPGITMPPSFARWKTALRSDTVPEALPPVGRMGWAVLGLILLLAGALRFYKLADIPAGLYCDEASIGYNAYSILKTGKDEHGVEMPLYFRAFGEFKNPVYIYTASATIAVFGLNELGTRAPSAFYGVLTVLLAFLIGRQLYGRGIGLIAAGLLAISPWHIHFSRISFELISMPFFFCLGLWLSLKGLATGRRSLLVLAGLSFGIDLYTYAIARLFVPLFLLGFVILYFRSFLRNKLGLLLGLLMLAAVATPQLVYTLRNPQNTTARWRSISAIRPELPFSENFKVFSEKYLSHFSTEFLFERGDPLKRHAVRGFGELYRSYLPWLALSLVLVVLTRQRQGFLLLWWLALFPVGASLTQETPTATRTIDAIPVFELILAFGVYTLGKSLASVAPGRLRHLLASGVAVVFLLRLVPDFTRYLDAYFRDYPIYSARGLDGFQHGYRDAVRYMEQHRKEYELLMLTATDVNQPEILALFYAQRDPAEYLRTRDTGYRISVPEEYGRYPAQARILYALRPEDVRYFLDYEAKLRVTAPDGVVSFIVAEIRTRRPLILDWQILGLLRREHGQPAPTVVDPMHVDAASTFQGRLGPITWQPYRPQFANLDLNRHFSGQAPEFGGNPEYSCAYLWTEVVSPLEVRGSLEIFGSPDPATIWWNGTQLAQIENLRPDQSEKFGVDVHAGPNQLLIQTCESYGDWNLQVSLAGEDLKPIPGLRFEAPRPHALTTP